MKVLIVYATNSSGTKEAAELIALNLTRERHAVTLRSAEFTSPDDMQGYEVILLGSCTWEMITPTRRFEGQLQQHMAALRDKLKAKEFPGQRFGIFALGDSSYTNFCIAANHLEALVKQLQGRQIGPTLRIDSYFFDLEKNRRKIHDWTRDFMHALSA